MPKEYNETIEGMRHFLNDVHAELRQKYKGVDIPSFIDAVIIKLEQMEEAQNEKYD
jgi:hypothetical protein